MSGERGGSEDRQGPVRSRAGARRRWRARLRDLVSVGAVLVPLLLLGLFAWMTWQPEAPLFDRLAAWPVIGDGVERLRRPWIETEALPPTSPTSADDGFVVVAPEAVERVHVGGGALVRAAPASEAAELLRTRTLRTFEVLERRGRWVRVALLPHEAATAGWIDLEAPREYEPILGSDPLPPGPLVDRPPSAERLAAALDELGDDAVEARLGPYPLWHDLDSSVVLAPLERLVARLEPHYAARYGVEPIGQPAAAVVLFARREDYLRFQDRLEELQGLRSTGHVAEGLVALSLGEGAPLEAELALVHELGHLLNRRALGPALPPWLDEGLAEELSELGSARLRELSRDEWLSRFRRLSDDGTRIELSGPLAALELMLAAAGTGRLLPLAELVALDRRQFVRGADSGLRYAQSGWFLHWLLVADEGRHASALRAFLRGVARGEPADGERLREILGSSWRQLDLELRAWLAGEALRLGVRQP